MTQRERIVPLRGIENDEALSSSSSVAPREPMSLDDVVPSIIYLDENYCVIDKPPGIRMDGSFPITIEKLVAKWTNRGIKDIKWMHQLDFATSGILCIGLHREAVAAVVSSFEHRIVRKAYLAVLQGHMHIDQWPEMSADQEQEYRALEKAGGEADDGKVKAVVEQHRQSLVSTGRNTKRKLNEITTSTKDEAEGTTAEPSTDPDSLSKKVIDPGSSWQEHVMLENLQACMKEFEVLTLEKVIAISPQLQADYEYLRQYAYADFVRSPKLRKLLRKLLSKCGVTIAMVASTMSEATTVLPQAAAAVEEIVAAKQTIPLTEEQLEDVCAQYRSPREGQSPAIFKIKSYHALGEIADGPTAQKLTQLQQQITDGYHLLVDIPVAELDGDFRMEPGHPQNPGKKAVTEVFILERGYYQGKPVTKVLMKPISGRRHQLRIHSRCLGHPIVGDFTYNPMQWQAVFNRTAAYQAYQAEHATAMAAATADVNGQKKVTIPVALRRYWDDQVAERMMLHAYCIHIPFPNQGRSSIAYKRKILEALLLQKRMATTPPPSLLEGETPEGLQQRLMAEIRHEFTSKTAMQIRDMYVDAPLIDIVTPVDPFCMVRDSPDGELQLRPVLPAYMQRHYEESSVVESSVQKS